MANCSHERNQVFQKKSNICLISFPLVVEAGWVDLLPSSQIRSFCMPGLSVSEHDDGELVVDSRLIAERLGIEHESFMETLRKYQSPVEEAFGSIRFETGSKKGPGAKAGGKQPIYALLTEDQATLLMTFSRNTSQVVKCKIELVQAFSKAKELLRQREPQPGVVPYWYQRMKLAMSDSERPLQRGYFCIYQEIMGLFAELENRVQYLVPDMNPKTREYLIPDISIGGLFNKFLRSDDELPSKARQLFLGSTNSVDFRRARKLKTGWVSAGSHYNEIRYYNHVYPRISHGEYSPQSAYAYPDKYLEIFRYFLQQYWVPDRCVPYLIERDPVGVAILQQRVLAMRLEERSVLAETHVGRMLPALLALPPAA